MSRHQKMLHKINVKKQFAAGLSIVSNSILIVLKIIVGAISGSISIISEALHSLVDLVASFIAFVSVWKSSQPADDDHPFGHGKYEDLAGFIEAILIVITALYILYIAGEKLLKGAEHHFETEIGIIVMIVSIAVNFFVSNYLFRVAKRTDSIALETDAEHLRADIYSSLAILLGLVAVKFTGLYVLDPIFAIIVAFMILKTGICLTKQSCNNLLDGALPQTDKQVIENTLEEFKKRDLKGVKSIKTSKSGSRKVINLIIFLPCNVCIKKAHNLCDEIEESIEKKLLNTDITIHAEPYCEYKNGGSCPNKCKEFKQKNFKAPPCA